MRDNRYRTILQARSLDPPIQQPADQLRRVAVANPLGVDMVSKSPQHSAQVTMRCQDQRQSRRKDRSTRDPGQTLCFVDQKRIALGDRWARPVLGQIERSSRREIGSISASMRVVFPRPQSPISCTAECGLVSRSAIGSTSTTATSARSCWVSSPNGLRRRLQTAQGSQCRARVDDGTVQSVAESRVIGVWSHCKHASLIWAGIRLILEPTWNQYDAQFETAMARQTTATG